MFASGSKSLAQPEALHRNCGSTFFIVRLSFLSASVYVV